MLLRKFGKYTDSRITNIALYSLFILVSLDLFIDEKIWGPFIGGLFLGIATVLLVVDLYYLGRHLRESRKDLKEQSEES